jgi:hypothetical protein
VAALAGPPSVVGAEWVQRKILTSRQNAATAYELAFDDALRVQTMLSMLMMPAAFCVFVAALIAGQLTTDFDWSGAHWVDAPLGLAVPALIGLGTAEKSKWARRYYLRRFAKYSSAAC